MPDGDCFPGEAAKADLLNAKAVARQNAWVVFDDTCFTPLRSVWAEALEAQVLETSRSAFCPTNRHSIARQVGIPLGDAPHLANLCQFVSNLHNLLGHVTYVFMMSCCDTAR